jgi:hypothetical protein
MPSLLTFDPIHIHKTPGFVLSGGLIKTLAGSFDGLKMVCDPEILAKKASKRIRMILDIKYFLRIILIFMELIPPKTISNQCCLSLEVSTDTIVHILMITKNI